MKVAGIMLKPDRIKAEMKQYGMDIVEGVVLFYPMGEDGSPDWNGQPQQIRDIHAAVSQTEHVIAGVDSQKARFDELKSGLDKLTDLLAKNPPRDKALSHFDVLVAPHIPSMRVRKEVLINLRKKAEKVYGFIGSDMYDKAADRIRDALRYIVVLQGMWDGQLKAWRGRRHLVLSVRNMVRKDPGVLAPAPALASSRIAHELAMVAKELTADSGDVPMYFNISDFVKSSDDKRISTEQGDVAEEVLKKAVLEAFEDAAAVVEKVLTKKYKDQLAAAGLVIRMDWH